MNKLVIKKLHYKNFKMLNDFELVLNEGKTTIEARNGNGKTTIFDGFSWLLFDKDSQGKQMGETIKTKVNHEYLHGLEHSVTGLFDYNGETFELKKIFYEKWVSKRGSTEKEFDGNTTDYYIDGTKVSAKKYKEYVSDIIDEDLFKLLTNPMYFNVNLDAKQRREKLFEIFGELVSDEDVINLRSDFAIVKKILQKQSLQEAIDSNKKELNALNKEIQSIPAQIKENQNSIFGCKVVESKKLEEEIKASNKTVNDLQERLAELKNGGSLAKKKNELLEVEGNLIKFENSINGIDPVLQNKLQKAYELLQQIKNDVSDKQLQIKRKQSEIDDIEEKTIPLRKRNKELQEYKPEVKETCESCGSPITEEKRKEALSKLNFNIAEELKEVKAKGIGYKRQKELCVSELETYKAEMDLLNERLLKGESYVKQVTTQLEESKTKGVDLSSNEEYKVLKRKQGSLNSEIEYLSEGIDEQLSVLQSKLNSAQSEQMKWLEIKSQQSTINNANKRIEELKESESKLAEKFESLSELQNTLEEYNFTKSELIEKRISEKFKTVSFRLFDKQVNGEIKPTCKTVSLKDGIAFDEGLNNGHRIMAGLDIIRVFSEHYGVYLPIFIDNAEGITEDYELNSQHVELKAMKVNSLTISGGEAKKSLSEPIKSDVVEYDDLDELF